MNKKYIFRTMSFTALFVLSQSVLAQNACDSYYAEAKGSPRSVVPRYNEDGTIKGFFVYDEVQFRRSTPSLQNAARRRAEAGVRQIWSGFVSTNLDAEAIFRDSVREEVVTTNTTEELLINEVNEQILTIKENTSAAVNGFVKMDECIDEEKMVVSVMYAWKPEFSQMGGDAAREMDRALNQDGATFSRETPESATNEVNEAQSRRTTSDVEF